MAMDPRLGPNGGIPVQRALNQSWPQLDSSGWHARDVKTQPADRWVQVRVRVVFEDDGEEWLDGTATRWHGRSVYVTCDDQRLQTRSVWVDAGDVRRV